MTQPENQEVERGGGTPQRTAFLSPTQDSTSALSGEISQKAIKASATHLTDGNVYAIASEEKRADGDALTEETEQAAEDARSGEAEDAQATEEAEDAQVEEAEDSQATEKAEDAQVGEPAEVPSDPTESPDEVELEALTVHFPMLRQVKSLEDIPEYARYRELRGMGLGIAEAFCASNADLFADAEAKRRQQQSKSHLHPLVTTCAPARPLLTESQRRFARATLGGDVSDSELDRLWCQVNK